MRENWYVTVWQAHTHTHNATINTRVCMRAGVCVYCRSFDLSEIQFVFDFKHESKTCSKHKRIKFNNTTELVVTCSKQMATFKIKFPFFCEMQNKKFVWRQQLSLIYVTIDGFVIGMAFPLFEENRATQ